MADRCLIDPPSTLDGATAGEVIFLPVGYQKIRSFYETRLSAEHGATFVTSQSELLPKVATLRPTSSIFHELFRRNAEPAFQSFLS